MTTGPSAYHREVAEQKRAAILDAATRLFLATGYDSNSLAKIAEAAGVSKATLFKQFPTKANLFDAIVTHAWHVNDPADPEPPPGDFEAGLTAIGRRYVALLTDPTMAALTRIVIAELPRFPELAEAHFQSGKMPYFDTVRRYLEAAHKAGTARVDDPELAATQFLGMISNFVLWPQMLVVGWAPGAAANDHAMREAVHTMTARFAT